MRRREFIKRFGMSPTYLYSAAGADTDADSGNSDGAVDLPVSGAADQHWIAPLREEAAAGKIAHEGSLIGVPSTWRAAA
jgi:hypothetical protein